MTDPALSPDEAASLVAAWRRIRALVDKAFNEHLHDYGHDLSPHGDVNEYETAYDYVERVLRVHERGES